MLMAAMTRTFRSDHLGRSPLSYWAGVRATRCAISAACWGGSWLTALSGDLGAREIRRRIADHANFQSNNPANTWWKKPTTSTPISTRKVSGSSSSKWWGVPVVLNAEEMQFIVDKCSSANRRRAAGKIPLERWLAHRPAPHPVADRGFCSFGDDITPPQQAQDWILELYGSVDDLIANGQTIVYSLHQAWNLEILPLSGAVATKEHRNSRST